MGTDNLGRDIFSRVVYAARVDLQIGFILTYVPLVYGVILGAVAGYFGGRTDSVIMRLVDVVIAFPFPRPRDRDPRGRRPRSEGHLHRRPGRRVGDVRTAYACGDARAAGAAIHAGGRGSRLLAPSDHLPPCHSEPAPPQHRLFHGRLRPQHPSGRLPLVPRARCEAADSRSGERWSPRDRTSC